MDWDNLQLWFKVTALIEEKDFEGANELLDDMIAQDPDNVHLIFAKSICLDAMGKFSEALEMANKARESGDNIVPDEFYNSLTFKAGNAIEKTPKISEESKIPSLLKSGVNLIERNEFNKAKLFFDRILSIQSENIEALICQAYCYDCLGMKSHAHNLVEDIDRFEIDPGFLRYYDELLGIDADDVHLNHESLKEVADLCDRGFDYIVKFKIKDAKVCFNKAKKLDENDVNPVVGNAYCLYHLGYYVLAFKECRKAINMDIESIDRTFYRKVKSRAKEV